MFRRAALVLASSLTVGALSGCPSSEPPPRPVRRTPSAAQADLPHAWPPEKGAPFPALELLDRRGNSVSLASLAGKVLLIEPVGISCPGCQAFSGGDAVGGFRGGQPQAGLPSMGAMFQAHGIDPAHSDLVVVQLLFYDMSATAAPTVADARDWAAHFGFDQLSNVHVLVGDERYVRQETYDLVPGFFLVDRDGVVVGNATGHSPQQSYDSLFDTLGTLLGTALEAEGPPFVMPADPFAAYPELAERAERARCRMDLGGRRFAELEERLQKLRAAGRRPGDFASLLDVAIDGLASGDLPRLAPIFDAWCAARPRSGLALLARGNFMIDYAWEARGSGYANTVTAEGRRLFQERLAKANEDLGSVTGLDATLAGIAHSRLITVGMGRQAKPQEELAIFKAALQADPTYVDTYTRRLTAIMPKWGGNEAGMWAFVKSSLAEQPSEPALQLMVVEAHLEHARMQDDDGRAYLAEATVRAALDEAHRAVTAAYPRSITAWYGRQEVVSMRGDRAGVREAVLKQAEAGAGRAQLEVAIALLQGAGGFARNRPKAVELALRAAHQDVVEAMLLLAMLLQHGEGVAADVPAAITWYRVAAGAGHEHAMLALGEVLGPADREEAITWLRQASGSEDPELAQAARTQLTKLEGEAR